MNNNKDCLVCGTVLIVKKSIFVVSLVGDVMYNTDKNNEMEGSL